MNSLHHRILEISNKLGLAHRGSCLTAVDIIDEIYSIKKPGEPFVLSSGHAGLALYVIIEKYYNIDAEEIYYYHGTHPDRCELCKLDCSTGSLGMGLPIALGMALADKARNVYCLISDGEAFEGVCWEVANVICNQKVTNLKVYLNYNGWSAYDEISPSLINKMRFIMPDINIRVTRVEDYGLSGLSAHYVTK